MSDNNERKYIDTACDMFVNILISQGVIEHGDVFTVLNTVANRYGYKTVYDIINMKLKFELRGGA